MTMLLRRISERGYELVAIVPWPWPVYLGRLRLGPVVYYQPRGRWQTLGIIAVALLIAWNGGPQ